MTLYRFTQVLNRCRLPYGWQAGVVYEGNRHFLRVGDPNGTCNVSGDPLPWWGRKWRLSEHMTDGEIVQTAFMAVMAAVEHETREGFTYRGVSVFDPHYDIEKLVELRGSPGGGLLERSSAEPAVKERTQAAPHEAGRKEFPPGGRWRGVGHE